MKILPTSVLLATFKERLQHASSVDIAVAWAAPSPALTALQEAAQRKTKVRVIVGLSGNGSHPEALRLLQEFAEVCVGTTKQGIFHPKFYLFRSRSKNVCWIGSANFTLGGFSTNSELVNEFHDDGSAGGWFDTLWDSLPKNSKTEIANYIDSWTRSPKRPAAGDAARERAIIPLNLLSGAQLTWAEYVEALKILDRYWVAKSSNWSPPFSVLGDEWSWLETIESGNVLVRHNDWTRFSSEEINMLLAYRHGEGAWGLLGSMKGAARGVGRILGNDRGLRTKIRGSLEDVISAVSEEDFLDAAATAVEKISAFRGIGPAIATRLITLARPDRGVSVNKGSATGFSVLASLPATAPILGSPSNYRSLLKWVYSQPWYNASEPENSLERTIWQMRAALLDSFVYQPI